MEIISAAIDKLYTMPLGEALAWVFIENLLIFLLSLGFGFFLVRGFKAYPVIFPSRITGYERLLAVSTLFNNTLVTFAGLLLWRGGLINLRKEVDWRAFLDILVLFMVMDCLMYLFHRVAHSPLLFPLLHKAHHKFEQPTPLTLFALNPLENLGFGGLWLVVLVVYPASWLGISVYLTLNVIFGLIGHLGVEPFPRWWVRYIVVRDISTSTFHAQHHQEGNFNFGFYTLIWDKLFGTISPHYPSQFGKMPASEAVLAQVEAVHS